MPVPEQKILTGCAMTDLALRPATALVRALRAGRLGSLELLEHLIARVERFNGPLNAIIATDLDTARRRARAADRAIARGEQLGPLHGLPITVKESFDVTGMSTTWGLPQYRENRARRNAAAVDRLVRAGAIVFGKTNVPVLLAQWQTFNPIYGTTNNPWDLTRTPGGSSGGAAAAIAAGLSALELGSDIGGSIRNPAHFTGLYGHKPTFGVVPTAGHALPGMHAPLDMLVAGPIARSAQDLELAMRVLVAPDDALDRGWQIALPPPPRRTLREYRIGVIAGAPVAPVAGNVQQVIGELASFLRRNKARVSETARPAFSMEEMFEVYIHLLRAATSAGHNDPQAFQRVIAAADALSAGDHSYHAELLRGNAIRHRDWILDNHRRHRMLHQWLAFFEDFDVMIAPVAPIPAFAHDHVGERHERIVDVDGSKQTIGNALFWAGYAGAFYLPATVVPVGRSSEGLPIGVQIIGPPGADRTCIALARLLEQQYRAFEPPPGYD